MTDQFDVWRAERKNPTPPERRADRPYDPKLIGGYYRLEAARMKWDMPVMIYTDPAQQEVTLFQIGDGPVKTTRDDQRAWDEFIAKAWLNCIAVSKDSYVAAKDTGYWPEDGKAASEKAREAQKSGDIIPDTPADQGGNMSEQDAADTFHAQVVEKISAAIKDITALGKIDSLEKANTAWASVEILRTVSQQGEAKRKAEKAPYLAAAAAVDVRWELVAAAIAAMRTTEAAINDFRRAEQRRLQREEDERQRKERERIAEETRKRLAAEAEEAARVAANRGEPEPEVASEEEIAAEAERIAAETVEETAQPVEAPVVRSAFGRAVPSRKKKVAVVEDPMKLATHFVTSEDADFSDYLNKRAAQAMRGKITLPGVVIEDQD